MNRTAVHVDILIAVRSCVESYRNGMINIYEVNVERVRTTYPLGYDGVGELKILAKYLPVLVLFR